MNSGWRWLTPVALMLLAGCAGVNAQHGKAAETPGKAGAALDACTLVPQEEADRLVPEATVVKDSRKEDYWLQFTCEWRNDKISHGDFLRQREIELRVRQNTGEGAKTGRASAQESYEASLATAKRGDHVPPIEGQKSYYSTPKELPGVGDGAFVTYTWTRTKVIWNSYAEAKARVGDMDIELKFDASQRRKDVLALDKGVTQSLTEENGIREVTGLVTHVAKGLAAWRAKHVDVLARPSGGATISPSATPSPTPLAAFPPICQAGNAEATAFVPGAKQTAKGRPSFTSCEWENRNVDGGKKVRYALADVRVFTNRSGTADPQLAKDHYRDELALAKSVENRKGMGNTWGKVFPMEKIGERAWIQYATLSWDGTPVGGCRGVTMAGSTTISFEAIGADLGPKVKRLPLRESCVGALKIARAMIQAG